MELGHIFKGYPILDINGSKTIDINKIQHNSNKIEKGDMFIAQRGFIHDGHNYIQDAINKGAVAVVTEKDIKFSDKVTVIKVENSTDALGYMVDKFYDSPWEKMNMVGITGTNGKTSISYYLKHIFDTNKNKSGLLGTIGAIIDKEHINLINTTPDALEIQGLLHEMVEKDIEYCCMEISSHALNLKRVKYMEFDIGIFTNLSQDHLDYHKDMDHYFESKLKLFYKTKKYNVINIDDPYGKKIIDRTGDRIPYITYGIKEKADIYATDIEYKRNKLSFILNTPIEKEKITLNMPTEFNIYNTLASVACGLGFGISINTIKDAMENAPIIKGRFELVPIDREFNVIIDYAHTPEGLKSVLKSINDFSCGRKIVVFGAGGDRDKTKRPEMGKIAGQYSDLAIVTSDNPRTENPDKIIDEVVKGVEKTSVDYVRIRSRKKAIEYAIKTAKPMDTILIAGKGHEEYIIIGNKKYSFNERVIVLDTIDKM